MTATLNTAPSDPVPAEIRDRLDRARAAVGAVIDTGDYLAYCRAKAAAKRELADAYEAAAKSVPLPPRLFHYAMHGASIALRRDVDYYEREARQVERERAEAKAARVAGEAKAVAA